MNIYVMLWWLQKNSPVKLSLNIIDLITDLFKQKNPRILL